MPTDTDRFIKGIISGEIKPAEVKTILDTDGKPMTRYVFPNFDCEIHAHFADARREVVLPSHIVPTIRDPKGKGEVPIDNYTLAMLRHYAEESNESVLSQYKAYIRKKRWWRLGLILFVLFLLVFIILLTQGSALAPWIYTHF